MPNSPKVSFNLINNNLEVTKPLNGISCVLARTTTGPIGLGDKIIKTVTQFRSIYGSEIVPDGSPSNIEKALKGGSKLRIIRVTGAGVSDNYLSTSVSGSGGDTIFNLNFTDGPFNTDQIDTQVTEAIEFALRAKGNQSDFKDYSNVRAKISADSNGSVYLTTYDGSTIFEKILLFTINYVDDTKLIFDYNALSNYLTTSRYWDLYWKTSVSSTTLVSYGVPTSFTKVGDGAVNIFKTKINGMSFLGTIRGLTVGVSGGSSLVDLILKVIINQVDDYDPFDGIYFIAGSPGEVPTLEEWLAATDIIRDLQDVYVVTVSNASYHLSTQEDELALHKAIAEIAEEYEEFQYFIELPVTSSDTYETIIEKASTYQGAVGKSKWVCYFSGGIKYYGDTGNLLDSPVLGTVQGLADACASTYGPYRSFAGLNRGVIPDGNGPVVPNYGTPSRYDQLNELANAYVNMIVLKQTRTAGLATVLWHSFTSQVRQDSFRYIHAVRLALYIKKQLRPILESYIEEPNIWNTWKRIYLESKPILDGLVTDDAISEYNWEGDQDATSWDELTVNNEADVRNGKYRLNIKVRDIATMQDIQVNLVYEQASNTVSASITSV